MFEEKSEIMGKTYSLYGGGLTSDNFYMDVEYCVTRLLENFNSPEELYEMTVYISTHNRFTAEKEEKRNIILRKIEPILSKYLLDVEGHLSSLSFRQKLWPGTIATGRIQYLTYMIEFEISNRINRINFLNAKNKIALLPHCLHDLNKKCESAPDGLDYKCRNCSAECYINKVSRILKSADITPYIWREAGKGKLFRKKSGESTGVLGIACLPELINGIRHVHKKGLPVVGIPLDANRCIRWLGDFFENSVNIKKLNSLLAVK